MQGFPGGILSRQGNRESGARPCFICMHLCNRSFAAGGGFERSALIAERLRFRRPDGLSGSWSDGGHVFLDGEVQA